MKLKQLLATFILCGGVAIAPLSPILAQPLRQISVTTAKGMSTTPAQITVWSGMGTNLDFTQTGETIKKVWLDDPSKITVDFDGDLNQEGAKIIHLRRVTGIQIPNLPSMTSTLLTVVTTDGESTHLYSFQIQYGTGQPTHTTVQITPDQPSRSSTWVTASGRTADLLDIELGLQTALRQNLIPADSPLVSRVSAFLVRARNGSDLETAAQASQVSLALLDHLAQMWLTQRFD